MSQLDLDIRATDKVFTDSPDSGDSNCICSRCQMKIPEAMSPILRVFPQTKQEAFGQEIPPGGLEYRFCWECSKELGIYFSR